MEYESGSFRDRSNRVFYRDGRVLRGLRGPAVEDWEALKSSRFFQEATESGNLIPSRELEEVPNSELEAGWERVLEHRRIPFISYPYEWSFGMLRKAALAHLSLLHQSIEEGLITKDGTSYNMQWIGVRPVFIDIASFCRLPDGSAWTGYRQFCQLFLNPLILQSYKNVPFQPLLRGNLEGIEPGHCLSMLGSRDLLRSGVFTHVYLQSRLQKRYSDTPTDVRKELAGAGFSRQMVLRNLQRLQKIVQRLKWNPKTSTWSDYQRSHNYSAEDEKAKEAFVRRCVDQRRWDLTWDLGCNVGKYSRIAAAHSDYVLALDGDQLAVDRFFRSLEGEEISNVLPLTMNLADPSPPLGWQLKERKALGDRGRPDLVLALALLHHLVIGSNVPLAEVISWLAGLGAHLVVEFVSKEDGQVQRLLRNKDDQYDDYTLENFENLLKDRFQIVERKGLSSGTRTLFFAVPA